ncbi:hypothetical protein BDR07DRAFT_1459074 [Suillus spraguei]|nr:hypothetical protein BDR07DRAFT_1459074 [Suillus spraguei]
MTIILNDPIWWSNINSYRVSSYFIVAACVGVAYDWALTFGQEVELVWRQPWSLMTVLYLGVRYLGIFYVVRPLLSSIPTISLTDTEWVWFFTKSLVHYSVPTYTATDIHQAGLFVMITRLYAMYQRSKKILTFLILIFLAVNIFSSVVIIISTMHASGEELILSGTHQCLISLSEDSLILESIGWVLATMWEALALCLAVWIAVKHFRELGQYSAGGIIKDCFTVLIKTHVLYFASFVAVCCFQLIMNFSLTLSMDQSSLKIQTYYGLTQILEAVQSFVLGPRLILSIREYHAKHVAGSNTATSMTSIVFQEHVHTSTGDSVSTGDAQWS